MTYRDRIKNISIRQCVTTFRDGAREFGHHPRQWLAKNGANAAGFIWNSGDGLQAVLGAVTLSPRIIISSFINITASSSSMIFGKRDWGVATNSALAVLGTGVFLSPSLMAGDFRTYIGFAGFCGAVSFGMFGAHLSEKFYDHPGALQRNLLGKPRRTMGSALFISRLPIIISAAAAGHFTTVAPFVVWSLGVLSMSLSSEEIALKRVAKRNEAASPARRPSP